MTKSPKCLTCLLAVVFALLLQGCGSAVIQTITPLPSRAASVPTETETELIPTQTTPAPTATQPAPTAASTAAVTASAQAESAAAAGATVDPTRLALEARDAAHLRVADAPQDGQAVFALRCAPCHGFNGEGIVGPSFRDRPLLTTEFVLSRVRSGPDVMSSFTAEEISDEQVAAVVDYLQTNIVGLDLPEFTEARIAEGQVLYREYCRECHGAFAQGKDNLGPNINLYPPLSVSRIVRGGLLPLPDMPRLSITPDELRLVATFIQSLGMQ